MTQVAVLKVQNYGEWLARPAGSQAGGLGPYSVDYLRAHGYEPVYSDATLSGLWASKVAVKGVGFSEWRIPETRGLRNVLANRRLLRRAPVTIGIFEDQGAFASFARPRPWLGLVRPRRMVLLVCWMAERVKDASPRQLRGLRRIAQGADRLVFFSANQAEIFQRELGVPAERLAVVPFGIDHEFFTPTDPPAEGAVVAVGGDGSRDHELLVEAARGCDYPLRLFAPRLAVDDLPPNVTWIREAIDHLAYRKELQAAQIVVVPTRATAYPGGQTVLLEAMATGRPVITTDSAAIRDYVRDGENGLLVPPGDRDALRAAIERLRHDPGLRASLGRAARRSVEECFNHREMWQHVARVLDALG